MEKVVSETLVEIALFKFWPQTVPAKDRDHFLWYAHSLSMDTKMVEVLWDITKMLASLIAGATNRTIEDKAMKVDYYLLVESKDAFTAFARENVDMTGLSVLSTNLFFIELHKCLLKGWRRALCESDFCSRS